MPMPGGRLVFNDGRLVIFAVLPVLAADGRVEKAGHAEVLFYGKTFSNFSKTCIPMFIGDKLFLCDCAEVLLHALKALFFGDYESFEKITKCKDPKEAKKLGRAVKGYDDAKWFEATPTVMNEIARLKLQCKEFRGMMQRLALLALELRIPFESWKFSEATKDDSKFGTGVSMEESFLQLQTLTPDQIRVQARGGANMMGLAIQKAFKLYTDLVLGLSLDYPVDQLFEHKACKDVQNAIKIFTEDKMSTVCHNYELMYGKEFNETGILEVVEDGIKRSKTESMEKTDEPTKPIIIEYVADVVSKPESDSMLVETLIGPLVAQPAEHAIEQRIERCGSDALDEDVRSVSAQH
jgi:predicted NAD-dependent protein-ADP-ribosyltransferase YbiA (DUF1768 family)